MSWIMSYLNSSMNVWKFTLITRDWKILITELFPVQVWLKLFSILNSQSHSELNIELKNTVFLVKVQKENWKAIKGIIVNFFL